MTEQTDAMTTNLDTLTVRKAFPGQQLSLPLPPECANDNPVLTVRNYLFARANLNDNERLAVTAGEQLPLTAERATAPPR